MTRMYIVIKKNIYHKPAVNIVSIDDAHQQ